MRESLVTTTWCTEHSLPRSDNFNLTATKRMKIDFKFKSTQIQKKITQIQPRNASKTAPLRAETAQPGTRHGSNCLASVRKCTFLTTGTNSAQLIFLRFEKKITFFFNLEKNPFLGKAKSAMSGSALAYVGTRHWGPGGGRSAVKNVGRGPATCGKWFFEAPGQIPHIGFRVAHSVL